ncbi:HTH_Tnp_Tc3_2 domain-containing protein [Trichonephila clavipes]|uniref:HTH_Tnp_Tc3_2 domain-containing protein n=1 Tax=Trichonephila clavipes TaxID=2585209 RepID=A0A8X6V295_TRICX|nr:HTH_Tnp_Tc3_2 domain-containing protein [Trichonephila clavipes]
MLSTHRFATYTATICLVTSEGYTFLSQKNRITASTSMREHFSEHLVITVALTDLNTSTICWHNRYVAREFDIAHSVVSRLWQSFKTTRLCSRWHGGGRVRSTTPAEDRYIVLSAKRNRCTTAQQVANQFLAASGKQISRKTVARRLRGGGLYARRPVVGVPLTRQHRTARLQ